MSTILQQIESLIASEGNGRIATANRFSTMAALFRADRTLTATQFTTKNQAQKRLVLAGYILSRYDISIPAKSKLTQAQVLFGWTDLGHAKVSTKVEKAIEAGLPIEKVESVYGKAVTAKDLALVKEKSSGEYKVKATTTLLESIAERLEKADFAKSAESDAEIARIEKVIATYKAIKMVKPVQVVTESVAVEELVNA